MWPGGLEGHRDIGECGGDSALFTARRDENGNCRAGGEDESAGDHFGMSGGGEEYDTAEIG
jgi:hypothetical protein